MASDESVPKVAGGFDSKLVKKVEKEGGKKGQDILGVHEMGGLEFFCTSVDTCEGDLELVNLCLNAMNEEVDPTAEEKRGGAGIVGKMIFSAGIQQLAIVAKIPEEKAEKVNVSEWIQAVVDRIGGQVVGTPTPTFAQAVALLDKEKGRYPIKMKDDAISAAVEFLQQHGCFPKSGDNDSDSDVVYGDDDF